VPIDYEAFGDLGGICTMKDGRKPVSGGKEAGDLSVHLHLLPLFESDDSGSAEEMDELVGEGYVELTDREAGFDGDQACGEVDFGEALVWSATADGDIPDVTEQRVEQV
jgi:hypothetical protein